MIFKLYFSGDENIVLPLANHPIIQGLIYDILLYDGHPGESFYNKSQSLGNYVFTLFTFGPLNGVNTVNPLDDTIIYHDEVNLELRSRDLYFCDILLKNLSKVHNVILGKNQLTLDYYE